MSSMSAGVAAVSRPPHLSKVHYELTQKTGTSDRGIAILGVRLESTFMVLYCHYRAGSCGSTARAGEGLDVDVGGINVGGRCQQDTD